MGDWITVYRDGVPHRIELYEGWLEFVVANGEALAKYVDESVREDFLKLVELAKELRVNMRECVAGPEGSVCVEVNPDHVLRVNAYVSSLLDLPRLVPVLDALERLYDRLLAEPKRVKRYREVPKRMKEIAEACTVMFFAKRDQSVHQLRRAKAFFILSYTV